MKLLNNASSVNSLFKDWQETIIWSCLQGVMGEIFVDNLEYPQSALAKLGKKASFGFLAGQPNIELLESCRGEDIILVPQHQGWSDLIETTYRSKAHAFTRYATKKDTKFDRHKLEEFVTSLPEEFDLQWIDEQLYKVCLTEGWSQDLVANYDDYQHYAQLGLGVVALYQGKVVGGASSYSTYENGIEIEIDTHPDFRRKGLAKAIAAKLILACLDRGLYPSWDAHTKVSLELAEKLSYEFSHDYIAYELE
ncbi:GNAT family N-acetyltransferase [Streptococcus ovuberis]|uniref:GNAT family N-acetyltransferase n=1 Tax=Streptococcus ovuberis TaxID=1936207 RepID=A0A7X6MZF2_9STRE|nr:GNAT family N-acetyltransferase [Streptococcus ovuberis]NKZ20263.1 GNAT family N-acetyltransferase [Streptococcus ovuberis]